MKRFEKNLGAEVAPIQDSLVESQVYPIGLLNSITKKGNDYIIKPADEFLIERGGTYGLKVYQRLLLDSTVQTGFNKLNQEIISRDLIVEPYSEKQGDKVIAKFVEDTLKLLSIDTITRGFLEAKVLGIQSAEIMWEQRGDSIVPYDIRFRDPRRFIFVTEEKGKNGATLRLLTRNNYHEGIEIPPRKFIVFRYWTIANNDPYGHGLGSILYPLVKFKRRAVESEILYGDRYAVPTVVCTSPLNATQTEIDTLYHHISNLSQETAIILPEGFKLEFISPNGKPDVFTGMKEDLKKEINLLLCGEYEVGNTDAGSRASSEVANSLRVVMAKEMSELLCEELNQSLIRWIVDLNFGTQFQSPRVRRDFPAEAESTLTASDCFVLKDQVGYAPTKDWLAKHFKVEFDDVIAEDEGRVKYDPNEEVNLDSF